MTKEEGEGKGTLVLRKHAQKDHPSIPLSPSMMYEPEREPTTKKERAQRT